MTNLRQSAPFVIFLVVLLLVNTKSASTIEYRDISNKFSINEFNEIKKHILKNGNRESYGNLYNSNPHFSFNGFDAFLNPETGQKNINCNPAISDFNEIVIKDRSAQPQYYVIHAVQKGDLQDTLIFKYKDMSEEKVYLLNLHNDNMQAIENNVYKYLESMQNAISTGINHVPQKDLAKQPAFHISQKKYACINIQFENKISSYAETLDFQGRVMLSRHTIFDQGKCQEAIRTRQLPLSLYICRFSNTH